MCKYDVFLSFRGEDTRKSFTDHLHAALIREGINVFKDDEELERGKRISQELFKAIEESKISVIVFSRNYASSTWCLDELAKIVECMTTMEQNVIPIFDDVDPSMVRKQTGVFGEAFAKHEETFQEKKERVQNWKNALTEVANLSGFHLEDRHETEFIKDIINDIESKLNRKISMIFEELVGIDSRLEKLKLLIDERSTDIRMIGICGMGGIGKTTIARILFESIYHEFEASIFLANVREISEKDGLVSLQLQLLSKILNRKYDIDNMYDGRGEIKRRLRQKKVLLVVDDVNDVKQLNALVGKHDWFGLGSRIIITSRDKHLLKTHGVDKVYEAKELNHDEALQLLILKAFKKYQPSIHYIDLSKRVVKYTAGLPLALEVLGSFLFDKTVEEWEDALERLNRDPENEIFKILLISFDGLKKTEKNIFLDIAYFFKGKNEEYVTKILGGYGFNPIIGIKVLVDKSLLTISNNELWMHDLLQEMGQQIVKRESPNEPGKRSRLWAEADIRHVLTKNTGSEVVEGIMVSSLKEDVYCSPEAFSKMINLRLLKISNVQLPKGLEYLSNELRLLDWVGYPLKSLPSNLKLDKVIELKLEDSNIEQLFRTTKAFNTLMSMNFKNCQYLSKIPDVAGSPNLKKVILEGCKRLHEIHPSLLLHERITYLNMESCTSLATLPNKIRMKSLKILQLSNCSKLKYFPEIVGSMNHLFGIYLVGTAIKELPMSIEFLTILKQLDLSNCKNLVSLPISINGLKSLKELLLQDCSRLENLPGTFTQLESLCNLDVSGTAVRQATSSIFLMKEVDYLCFDGCKGSPSNSLSAIFSKMSLMPIRSSDSMAFRLPSLSGLFTPLTTLSLRNCNLDEEAIPSDFFESFSSLMELDLSNNNFVSLPKSINCLSKLQRLKVNGCTSLMTLSNASTLCNLKLSEISCLNCLKLKGGNNMPFSMLKEHLNKADKFGFFKWLMKFKVQDMNNNYGLKMAVPGSKILEWYNHWEIEKLRKRYPFFKQLIQIRARNFESFGENFDCFRMVVPASEIPEWFSHKSEILPEWLSYKSETLEWFSHKSKIPERFNHKYKGFGHSQTWIKRPPYIYNNSKLAGCLVCFVLDSHCDNDIYQFSCQTRRKTFTSVRININEEVGELMSEHLVLIFFPREGPDSVDMEHGYNDDGSWFSLLCTSRKENWKRCGTDVKVMREKKRWDYYGEREKRGVKRWGVHMVYEQDVEEMNKIDNHSTWWNWNPFIKDDDGGSTAEEDNDWYWHWT